MVAPYSVGNFQGEERLLRLLFKLVSFGEVVVAAGTNVDVIVEELPELSHAFYLPPSVYEKNDPGVTPVDVMFCGPGITIAAGPTPAFLAGISATLFKRRKTGTGAAIQQEIHLYFANQTSIDSTLVYEVYRISGLK